MTTEQHQDWFKTIHDNTGQLPSDIDRGMSKAVREKYWMERAAEIEKSLEELRKR